MITAHTSRVNSQTSVSSYEDEIRFIYVTQDELDELDKELHPHLIHKNSGRITIHSILLKIIGGTLSKFDECFRGHKNFSRILEQYGYYKNVTKDYVKACLRKMRKRGWITSDRKGKRLNNKTELTDFGRKLYLYHIKKNQSSTQIKLSTKNVDNLLLENEQNRKITPHYGQIEPKNEKNNPSYININIYKPFMIHTSERSDAIVDNSPIVELPPPISELRLHANKTHIPEIQENPQTEESSMSVVYDDLAINLIKKHFSGDNVHLSICNGELQRMGSDKERRLAFANAMVAAINEKCGRALNMLEFSQLKESVIAKLPVSYQRNKDTADIDSYAKLRAAGIKISDPKPETTESVLPFSVEQQIKKLFFYQELDHVRKSLEEVKIKHSLSEANLITLAETVHSIKQWLYNEKKVRNIDVGMLVRTQYNKLKGKYQW